MKPVSRNLRGRKASISRPFARAGARFQLALVLAMFNLIAVSAYAQRRVDTRESSAHPAVPPNSQAEPARGEYADLKLSYPVRRMARLAGVSPETVFHLCWDFNFVLMVGLIVWKCGPLLKEAIEARSRSIRRAIEDAQRLNADAGSRLAEVEKRWAQLDSEIAAIQNSLEAQMKGEEELLSAKTTEEIRRIMEDSQFEIDQASRRARDDLKAFAAELAVSLAHDSIQINQETDQALITGLIHGVGHQQLQTSVQPSAPAVVNT